MTGKKYQVFISSTYEDLKMERKAVEETIIRAGDFPVGMEGFPAADEDQLTFIKTIIDQSDYYVLIIAGRYGSLAPDGKSYTEKEYEYAVEVNVPVLVMLRDKRETLPANMTERDRERHDRLEAFISCVSTSRVRKTWSTTDELKLAVREALDHSKATKPRPGWIRGHQSTSQETLEKLEAAREEIDKLKAEIGDLRRAPFLPPDIAGMDTAIKFVGSCQYRQNAEYRYNDFKLDTTVGEMFDAISSNLVEPRRDQEIGGIISKRLFKRHNVLPDGIMRNFVRFRMEEELFETLRVQLTALGLVKISPHEIVGEGNGAFWSLTDLGRQEMMRRHVLTTG